RHLGVDPEAALRAGNAKFEARFRAIEADGGATFAASTLEEKEDLWQAVKRRGG
ncbi:MAG: nucleoside triphosphate pyrophosphohydrolase, partial [Sphingomonas sp.]